MDNILPIIILVTGLGVGWYVSQSSKARLKRRAQQKAVDEALNPDPRETAWVNILVNARKTMPAEQYQKFESAVMDLIDKIKIVNRSGLQSSGERVAMLQKLVRESGDPQLLQIADQVLPHE